MSDFKLKSGAVYGVSCQPKVTRENTIYAVEIIGYHGVVSELVEAWQLTRATGWAKRETKMVWKTIHDSITKHRYSNVVAYVFNATLDDAIYHCAPVMKFQSYITTYHYPDIVVHDITRNMNALNPWEYVTRRHSRVWHFSCLC